MHTQLCSYSQITAASDWPRPFCTLGVFAQHTTAFCHICTQQYSTHVLQFSLDNCICVIIISYQLCIEFFPLQQYKAYNNVHVYLLRFIAGLNGGHIHVPTHIANQDGNMSYTIAQLGHACSLHIARNRLQNSLILFARVFKEGPGSFQRNILARK